MSFRLKTILGIAAIEVALLAILIVSGLYYLKSSNEQQLLERGRTTAQLLATMTSDAVLATDLATLDALVAQSLRNKGIVYVRVRHKSGVVMSEGGDLDALEAEFSEDESVEKAQSDGRLDVSFPIFVANDTYGRIEIGLSTSIIDAVVGKASSWMLTIAAVEIALVGVFGLILGTVLTGQLARLRKAAGKVASGEFGYQLKVRGKDELADTTKSFNRMSLALADFAQQAREAQRLAEEGRDYAQTVLHDAMNSMPQGVLIVDPDETVSFANNAFKRTYPATVGALADRPAFQAVAPIVAAAVQPADDTNADAIADDRIALIRDAADKRSWESTLADGTRLMTSQRRMSGGGTVIVETDVTELYDVVARNQQLEIELVESQKREAMGTLAGGVAHEINTPIQYVSNNLRFLSDSFGDIVSGFTDYVGAIGTDDDALKKSLKEMDWEFLVEEIPSALAEATEGVDSVSKIVLSMKEVSYPETDDKVVSDIAKILDSTLTVSRNQWKYCATVELDIDENLPEIPCFPGELSQVFINLIVNAAHAIEERHGDAQGTIRISIHPVDDSLEIRISDDGAGIAPENLKRIFDMFFTTKAPGKGTGQGLSICNSIVTKRHGGTLTVASEPGEGTTFTITLPRTNPAETPTAEDATAQ